MAVFRDEAWDLIERYFEPPDLPRSGEAEWDQEESADGKSKSRSSGSDKNPGSSESDSNPNPSSMFIYVDSADELWDLVRKAREDFTPYEGMVKRAYARAREYYTVASLQRLVDGIAEGKVEGE
jgi:hypothetical protein